MGVVVSVLIFGGQQLVRPPASIFMLPFFAALVAAIPSLVPKTWPWRSAFRGLVYALLAVGLIKPVEVRYRYETRYPKERDQILRLARDWRELHEGRENQPIIIEPGYELTTLHFYLTGHHISTSYRPEGCSPYHQCYAVDRQLFIGSDLDKRPLPAGLYVSVSCERATKPVQKCEMLRKETCFAAYHCPEPN